VRLVFRGANFTVVYLAPERIPNLQPNLLERRELVPTIDPEDEQLSKLMSSIRLEMQADFAAGRAYFESQALSLTIRLFALYSVEAPAGGVFRGGLAPRQIRQAKNRILVDLDKSVSVTALAREAGLSRSHFCRAFKQSTGVSPHQWRLKKRFERALALLADDSVTLTNIADALGFASLSHFSAAFKRATGLTPSQYRRQFAS
jgi:AraC family transcriptional regulator